MGDYLTITLQVVAEALGLRPVLSSDEKTMKEWIKDYSMKVVVRAVRKALCMPDQAKWKGKKEKFQAELSCASLWYPYKA